MARRKAITTKLEIIQCATRLFFEKGYGATSPRMICDELEISTGNLTYYFPTKEDLLAVFVKMLCDYQKKMMEIEANEGVSSMLGICLELTTMAAMCEEDEAAKDFYLASYTSPKCLDIIRRSDVDRAKEVFRDYCSAWAEEDFVEAEILVSGIEYATLMTTDTSASLETRIAGALNNILAIYNVPESLRQTKINKVLALDYRRISRRVLKDFKIHIEEANEKALDELLPPKA